MATQKIFSTDDMNAFLASMENGMVDELSEKDLVAISEEEAHTIEEDQKREDAFYKSFAPDHSAPRGNATIITADGRVIEEPVIHEVERNGHVSIQDELLEAQLASLEKGDSFVGTTHSRESNMAFIAVKGGTKPADADELPLHKLPTAPTANDNAEPTTLFAAR